MTTEVLSVRIGKDIVETLRKAGIDPKREIKEHLTMLARIAEKKKVLEDLRRQQMGPAERGTVVEWIREDRER